MRRPWKKPDFHGNQTTCKWFSQENLPRIMTKPTSHDNRTTWKWFIEKICQESLQNQLLMATRYGMSLMSPSFVHIKSVCKVCTRTKGLTYQCRTVIYIFWDVFISFLCWCVRPLVCVHALHMDFMYTKAGPDFNWPIL